MGSTSPPPRPRPFDWPKTVIIGSAVLVGVLVGIFFVTSKVRSPAVSRLSAPTPASPTLAEQQASDANIVLRSITAARSMQGIGDYVMTIWQYALRNDASPQVIGVVAEIPAVRTCLESLRAAVPPFEKPTSMPDTDLLALHIACQQYADSVVSLRGTWSSYTREVSELRLRLDAALMTVEARLATPEQITAAQAAAAAKVQELRR
jgi:hypothetical protein